MPAGTTIKASAPTTTGTVTQTPDTYTVGCDAGQGGADVTFSLTAAGTANPSGSTTILVTSPGGTVTVYSIPRERNLIRFL